MIRTLIFIILAPYVAGQGSYSADIHLDEGGIPHIEGATVADVAYGSGWQQMRDFPLTAMYVIAQASGSLAEVLGQGSDFANIDNLVFGTQGPFGEYVRQDIHIRHWRIPDHAQNQLNILQCQTPPDIYNILVAFAKGLDDGRQAWQAMYDPISGYPLHQESEPLFFHDLTEPQIARLLARPITALDVMKASVARQTENHRSAIAGCPSDGCPPPPPSSSNAWIVSKTARSDGQYPIFLADPHLPTEQMPTVRSYVHTLKTTGSSALHAAGLGVVGMFGVLIGCTDTVAWSFTSNVPDVDDAWTANLNSGQFPGPGGAQYSIQSESLGPNGVHPLYYWNDTLASLQLVTPTPPFVTLPWADPDKLLPIVKHTGNTINFVGTGALTAERSWFEFFTLLSQATTIGEVNAAVELNAMPDQHMLAVSSGGDMRYWYLGRVPVRQGPAPGPACPPSPPPCPCPTSACPCLTGYHGYLDSSIPSNWWNIVPSTSCNITTMVIQVHPVGDSGVLPHLMANAAAPPPEVWAAINSHPTLVTPGVSTFPYTPSYAVGDAMAPTLRQLRLRQLLPTTTPPSVTTADHFGAASDVYDNWMAFYLPYFQAAIPRLGQLYSPNPIPSLLNDAVGAVAAWLSSAAGGGQLTKDSQFGAFAAALRADLERRIDHKVFSHLLCPEYSWLFRGLIDWHEGPVGPPEGPLPVPQMAVNAAAHPELSAGIDAMAEAWNYTIMNVFSLNRIVNTAFTNLTLSSTPWSTPSPDDSHEFYVGPYAPYLDMTPFNELFELGPTGPILKLGYMRLLESPLRYPYLLADVAFYPLSGSTDCLFAIGGGKGKSELMLNDPCQLNGTGCGDTFLAVELNNGGSTSQLIIDFKPDPQFGSPRIDYLTPIGPTEFRHSPRRYLPSDNYGNRSHKTLRFATLPIVVYPQHVSG